MARAKPKKPDDPEQSKAFIEKAREIGAAEAGLFPHQAKQAIRVAAADDPPPPATIDPDSIQGRLTLIEERLRLMSIELDSLKVARTERHRHRAVTKQRDAENRVKIGLAATLIFVLALFLLYAELAPSPNAALGPSATVFPPVGPSTTPDP
jgi:hypothetical protein